MLPLSLRRAILERVHAGASPLPCSSLLTCHASLPSPSAHISTGAHTANEASGALSQNAGEQPSTSSPLPSRQHRTGSRTRMTKQQFLGEQADSETALLRHHQEAASLHGGIQRYADMLRTLRRHNYSLPALRGQVVLATVLSVSSGFVRVDPGFHSITEVPRGDVDINHVHTAARGQALEQRESSHDLRVGDVISVAVDAVFTPYGDMQVEAVRQDPQMKKRALWRELEAAWKTRQPVFGRVLNQCPGGYAVGISGFVALLPYARATTQTTLRIGELTLFYIDQLNEQQQLLIVRDGMLQQRR